MKMLFVTAIPAMIFAGNAFAECSNIVLNMKDIKSEREITTVLDCHDASATIPGATTMHFMEWKHGKLCQSIQNCGNVFFWKGQLSVGANWYWGNSLTNFKQTTDSVNKFAQTANAVTNGGSSGGSEGSYRCTDFNKWSEFERGGYVKGTAGYYMNASQYGQFSQDTCANYDLGRVSGSQCTDLTRGVQIDGGYYVQGEAAKNWLSAAGNSKDVLTCGYLDNNFAQNYSNTDGSLLQLTDGQLKTSGSANTDWHTDGIQANFSLDFGQINRSCSAVEDFGCL